MVKKMLKKVLRKHQTDGPTGVVTPAPKMMTPEEYKKAKEAAKQQAKLSRIGNRSKKIQEGLGILATGIGAATGIKALLRKKNEPMKKGGAIKFKKK